MLKFLAVLMILLAACAPAGPGRPEVASPAAPAAPKRIVTVAQDDPPVLVRRLATANSPGLDGIENLYNHGLAGTDKQGSQVPLFVEQIPTVANGLWKVLPDGRMET